MKINSIILIAVIVALVSNINETYGQITIDTAYTPEQLVRNVLLGPGVSASNIQCNCPPGAFGSFIGTNSNIGLPGGVILTTGNVFKAIGPNYSDSATGENNTIYFDPQLISIESAAYNDPCILEFDFIPDSDYVEFRYVFGSEEYNEYVDDIYNDAFGFFLTGPGITNPNNNIALLPSSSVPISINTVNNGFDYGCPASGPCTNCQYYIDNCGGTTVQYDGFTTLLTAKATITKGLTYHIKLAIADAADGLYDSGVFFQCGSFSTYEGGSMVCNTLTNVLKIPNKPIGIFPNPATSVLNVSNAENITSYEIINAMGQTLESEKGSFSSPFIISLKKLSAGTYILRTNSSKGFSNLLFFKE